MNSTVTQDARRLSCGEEGLMTTASGCPRVSLFGLPIGACTLGEVLDVVDRTIETGGRLQIGVVNAAKIVHMRTDRELREALRQCDLILADGMSVVWASRLLGRPLPERVAGIDIMTAILSQTRNRPLRVYFLGATPRVLDAAVAHVRRDYPAVSVVGWHHGYFRESEEAEVAADIRRSEADVLFVAMTSPKKERFLARWTSEMNVPVTHGVGGSLDVLAGEVRRAPPRWQRWGLEWLYRLKQEPRRMWRRYLITNTWFCLLLGKEMLRSGAGRRRASA